MGRPCKKHVGGPHGRDELMDFAGVLDAFKEDPSGSGTFDAGTHINGQA